MGGGDNMDLLLELQWNNTLKQVQDELFYPCNYIIHICPHARVHTHTQGALWHKGSLHLAGNQEAGDLFF